jgi:hypothetical protein
MDALPPILQMLMGGHFRFVSLRGVRFRYRQALCNSFWLEMKLEKCQQAFKFGSDSLLVQLFTRRR